MANILIIGCGAIGTALAHQLIGQGHHVFAIKRNPPSEQGKIHYIAADITSATEMANLVISVNIVFFIVSADGRTEQSYRDVYETGLQNALNKFAKQPWFFVSSTSVYGQSQGEWVDENSPTEPEAITSQLIWQAEQRIAALNPKNVVVRFSGIYGPGREYLLRTAQNAPIIQQNPPYFTNRIHQQDCVGVLAFLLTQRLAGVDLEQCYLASDNDPASLWEVMSWLAEQMHCSAPIAKVADTGAGQNKRCNNSRLTALGYQFAYSSYKDGYTPLIKHE